ncbi:MAG: HAMP domain-containing protein, partial [Akkermansiaceae bacterium]|nr:HAMP domain-containing protein [Akkermansiaceae bacterium]
MRIRWKLFLSLFILTAGAIAVVLAVSEREFRGWVKGEITWRFEAQLGALLEARTERLAELRKSCMELATHPTIRRELKGLESPALREQFLEEFMESRPGASGPGGGRNRPDADTDPARPGASKALRDNIPGAPPAGRMGGGGGRGNPILGVIDLEGNPRPFGGPLQHTRANRKLASERVRSLSQLPSQGVAYVVFRNEETDRSSVQEVVLTPVIDDDGTLLGWFFLGRDAETRIERAFQQTQLVSGRGGRSGLVVEGQWFMNGVSDDEATAIKAGLSDAFWTNGKPEILTIEGSTLLLIARGLNPDSPLGKGYLVGIFPLDSFIEALAHLHTKVAWIGGAAILATSLLALFLAHRFSRPIAELVAGTERVRQGNLAENVTVRSKDEFGTLAAAFNAMTRDLALKERYREVLSKVSDPAVAQQLIEGQLELGGEVLNAAVLFCDIRGFTRMTEGMPPAEVIEFVNEHMTALTKLVYLHGGVVDKFVGD